MNARGVIILIISIYIFNFLIFRLDKYNPKIFSLFHKIPEKWKGKWPIQWLVIFVLLFINAFIKVYFELSDLIGYIIAGFLISLCDFIFKKPQEINNSK